MALRGRQALATGRRIALGIGLSAGLLATTACTTLVQHHGYVPDDAALAQIAVGRDTRETVAAAIGRPSSSGVLSDGGWFYVGSRWEQFGPRLPREVEREVVAISFDPAGRVANIERFGLEDGQVVPLSRRVTDSQIDGTTLLQQLLRNVGRFTAAQFID